MRKQGKQTGTNSPKRIGRFVLIAGLVAVFALGAMAAISLRTSQAKNSASGPNGELLKNNAHANIALRVASQQVPIDEQTGQIRPLTQEEAQRLAAGINELVNQSTDGLRAVRHADGSVSMDLDGHFQNVIVAKKNEDGTVSQSCVDNRQTAAEFFGIDPQLVGVKPNTASPRTAPLAPPNGRNQ